MKFISSHTLTVLLTLIVHLGVSSARADNLVRIFSPELIAERARNIRLWDYEEWKLLLHYQDRTLGGTESWIDDSKFFLAPDGKQNAEAELFATISAFFAPPTPDEITLHPQCAFPARRTWILSALGLSDSSLPQIECSRLDNWLNSLNVQGITVVYPSAYMNNPASLFGHTLLRLDNSDTHFLSYGASYAASTGDDGGIPFAYKGLMGHYDGTFSITPYFELVRLYSDFENRDIWEYTLNLTSSEIRFLLLHLWELGSTRSEYYFFDENCASALLELMRIIRPKLPTARIFPGWIMPLETLRAITDTPGFVNQTKFRPSAATKLRHDESLLSYAEKLTALNLAEGRIALDEVQLNNFANTRATLLLAADALRYRNPSPDSEDSRRIHELLLTASQLMATETTPDIPLPSPPESAHNARRVTVGANIKDDDGSAVMTARILQHTLTDPPDGYLSGAELTGVEISLNAKEESNPRIDRFTLLEIRSIAPRDLFLRPTSWGLHLLGENLELDRKQAWVNTGSLDAGLATELAPSSLIWLLGRGGIETSEEYRENYAAGLGGVIGGFWDPTPDLRTYLEYEEQRFGIGDEHSRSRFTAEARYILSKDVSIFFTFRRGRDYSAWSSEEEIRCAYYF